MLDGNEIKKGILDDMRVELSDEFDKNFERKAFFSKAWKKRAYPNPKGSLLMVTGTLRRSIKAHKTENGVRFTSSVPYASIHNEGGRGSKTVRSHTRTSKKGRVYTVRQHTRKFTMPQRQFIGDSPRTQQIIRSVIEDNLKEYNMQLSNFMKK